MRPAHLLILLISIPLLLGTRVRADEFRAWVAPFLTAHCVDCHGNSTAEGGLNLAELGNDLDDEATFGRWVRVFDRVHDGEMPPQDADQPPAADRSAFVDTLQPVLSAAHARTKGTVLRRLNRREYENTLNDLFGTNLGLAGMLPEDGRSHEFDNVGEALGISLVHLERYMEAAGLVWDTAIAKSTEAPEPKTIVATYADSREAERFLGDVWKKLPDGAVVQFGKRAYPSGMLRGSSVRDTGRYRVRITGYAYQSDEPITFSVGGTSFARGSEKPIHGFFSFPPGGSDEHHTIEYEAWIESRYMLSIDPYGISDPERFRKMTAKTYDGPGLAIVEAELVGPLVGEFPSRGHRLVFDGLDRREIEPRNPNDKKRPWYTPQFEVRSVDEPGDARRSIERVARAAFRRPVTEVDVAPYLALFQDERAAEATFEESLRTAVVAVLCSPNFLYLDEDAVETGDADRLGGHALAARLSYFLTRTTPDDELLALANDGRLSDPATLRTQTERLLADPRFERFLVDFTDGWLDLRQMDFTVPDGRLFPEYDHYLRHAMPLETRAFLAEMLRENLPVTNLVKSDFAMLNDRLAAHYELPAVTGSELRRVPLPADGVRGGLLTQAAILKVTANGTNTSPVTRGAWVMERLLGETPPPPPPGIPGVEPDVRGATTLRELLDKHRDQDNCRACHARIDPPGFALESFNPIGGYRKRYRSLGDGDRVDTVVEGRGVRYRLGPTVDPSGELREIGPFDDYIEFRDQLAAKPDLLARTLTEKLLVFATGRELGFSDRPEIDRIVRVSAERGHGVRDLLHLVVQSEIFRSK